MDATLARAVEDLRMEDGGLARFENRKCLIENSLILICKMKINLLLLVVLFAVSGRLDTFFLIENVITSLKKKEKG